MLHPGFFVISKHPVSCVKLRAAMKRIPFIILSFLLIGAGCTETVPEDPHVSPEPDLSKLTAPSSPPDASAPIMTEESPDTASMTDRSNFAFPGVLPAERTDKNVRIKTNKGDIVFELLPDEGPNAASNFVYLTELNYFDGLTFHRVEPGFVIQGGDPEGTGRGGPGYSFEDDPVSLSYDRGIVAMANAGPNTNGSQFFIMLDNNPLPPNYSIFGRVIKGMDVVDQIRVGDTMTTVTLEEK